MKNEKGFSLLSIMIAMIMISVGVMALAKNNAQIVEAHNLASAKSTALSIARAHMERLRTLDPLTLASESAVLVDNEGATSSTGPFTRTVVVDNVSHNLKRVIVRVTLPQFTEPVELVTLTYFNTA